ncbi:hypothetical protein [Curtobacterium sp. MCPF17_052]|uniref:hypothetical protein n=1 Tax=Curtobacterium sp. MCPF17_052 TaxID=2175655 RepID=UPI0024DFCB39|nr:hypothetical protein [Curtobacterium sp. MCPF17_052]WIB13650.1 hypothetical protein DEJ36_08065 [Curtobacterium sp. MCPF17_052]
MVDVHRVKLPGVGVLHSFYTDDGGKCGVITHRSGHSDLISFADVADGADKSEKVSLRLSEDEAHTLAELLGGTRITEGLDKLDEIPGLSIDWFSVDYDDAIAGKPLGDLHDSGFIGLTVVAVVRGDSANPAPLVGLRRVPRGHDRRRGCAGEGREGVLLLPQRSVGSGRCRGAAPELGDAPGW